MAGIERYDGGVVMAYGGDNSSGWLWWVETMCGCALSDCVCCLKHKERVCVSCW